MSKEERRGFGCDGLVPARVLGMPLLFATFSAIAVGCGAEHVAVAPDAGLPESAADRSGEADTPYDPSSEARDDLDGGTKKGGANKDAGKGNTGGTSSDAGTFVPDDPALEDPARPSLPFECQGPVMTASDAIEHVSQGSDSIVVSNGDNWNGTAKVLRVFKVERRCHPATGCSAWAVDIDTDIAGTSRHDYPLRLVVSTTGALSLVEALWQAPTVLHTIQKGDFQATFAAVPGEAILLHLKTRITRPTSGAGCLSVASIVTKNAPAQDGSATEWFYWGKAALPNRQTIPRTIQPARASWASHCAGTPASNVTIASWFSKGATRLNFDGNNARRQSSQQCHPITGCTPWSETFAPSDEMYGLQTTATGFAVRFDGDVVLPIVDGKVSGPHPVLGGVEGVVTSSKCVSYDAKKTDTYTYLGSSVTIERHLEEAQQF